MPLTRFAVFVATGHAGQVAGRPAEERGGREEVESPDGWTPSRSALRRKQLPGPRMSEAPVALYVHFPFCVSVCPYCDFVVYGGKAARGPQNRIADLVDALVTEMGTGLRAASGQQPGQRLLGRRHTVADEPRPS